MTEPRTERELCLRIADGSLPSPQIYCGNLFVKLTLCEAGARADDDGAIRVRPADAWLTSEMTARCVGLPIIASDGPARPIDGDHLPEIIGSVLHPFVDGDKLLAVARIFHSADAPVDSASTRLCTVSDDARAAVQIDDDEGGRILIEPAPRWLDHVAI
jgi:hypothetical protein